MLLLLVMRELILYLSGQMRCLRLRLAEVFKFSAKNLNIEECFLYTEKIVAKKMKNFKKALDFLI